MKNRKACVKGIKKDVHRTNLSEMLIIGFICFIAFALRIAFLDNLSFWIDESTSVLAAKGLLENGLPVLPSGDYYSRSFVHVWTLAQSFKLFGISEFSARLPSVIFGTVSVALTYYFAKSMGYKEAGFIASLMMAFSFWAIWFSREARMYALLQLIYIFSLYMLWLGFEGGSTARDRKGFSKRNLIYLLLAAIGFVVGFFTHELMALFFGFFWLYVLTVCLLSINEKGWVSALKSKYGITAVALSTFGLIVLTLLVATGKLGLNGKIAEEIIPKHIIGTSYMSGIRLLKQFLFTYPFLSIMAFVGSITLVKARDRGGLYLLISFWFPVLALVAIKATRERYLYFTYPSFLLLAAIGIIYLVTSLVKLDSFNVFLGGLKSRTWPKLILIMVLTMLSLAYIREVKHQIHGNVPKSDLYVAFYPNWKLASKIDSEGKTIITADPITAYYYFGRVDYMVRLTQLDFSGHWFRERGMRRERYTGSRFIGHFGELKSVIEGKKNNLVVIQRNLWDKKLTEEAKDYIWKNLRYRNDYSDESIYVFTSN